MEEQEQGAEGSSGGWNKRGRSTREGAGAKGESAGGGGGDDEDDSGREVKLLLVIYFKEERRSICSM
jgi:hypothetical protein